MMFTSHEYSREYNREHSHELLQKKEKGQTGVPVKHDMSATTRGCTSNALLYRRRIPLRTTLL